MGAGTILVAVARGPWPLLLLASLTGWTALVGSGVGVVIPIYCSVSADYWIVLSWWSMEDALFFNPVEQLVVSWLLMLLAMMAPLLTQPISHLWHRSLARRRLRAIAIFVAGYATIWLMAGIILTIAAIILKALAGAGPLHASVFAIAIAVLWQVTPAKQYQRQLFIQPTITSGTLERLDVGNRRVNG